MFGSIKPGNEYTSLGLPKCNGKYMRTSYAIRLTIPYCQKDDVFSPDEAKVAGGK